MGEAKHKRQAEAARQTGNDLVVHTDKMVVHKPERSSDRHADRGRPRPDVEAACRSRAGHEDGSMSGSTRCR
jgi:hypothetical protein